MKIICIVQARVGSTRLPGKVLKKICGKTVLEHDINRLKQAKNIDEIVIATTTKKEDDAIVDEAKRLNVKYFRGSERDVLSRYYYAAKENKADIVIRVTSDCPCIDYQILDNMIKKYLNNIENCDYMNNTIERTFPRGYDIEIFSFKCLKVAFEEAELDYEREHVTPYLYDSKNNFKVKCYKNNIDYSKYRLTLDTQEDFEVIKRMYEELYSSNYYFLLDDAMKFLKNNPEISNINIGIKQKKLGE